MKENLEAMLKYRSQRLTYREIGEKFGVTKQRIHQIIKNYGSYIKSDYKKLIRNKLGNICHWGNCGKKSNLIIHHLDGNSKNNKLENLILLCKKHHNKTHQGENKDCLHPVSFISKCIICGKEIKTYFTYKLNPNTPTKTCSDECLIKLRLSRNTRPKKFKNISVRNMPPKLKKKYYKYVNGRNKEYRRTYYLKNKDKIKMYAQSPKGKESQRRASHKYWLKKKVNRLACVKNVDML